MAFSLSDYTGLKQIAQGGMGKVYLATQVSLGRKVVIKEMAAGLLTDESQIRRFENEAKAAGSLDHDNVIRVYDFGEDRESFYITMEYIDGPDLENLLRKQDFVPEIGLMVALHALKGLNYAHEHGIIHRDVKPANIMLSKAGAVKVLDFGLAHASAQSMHLTATDAVIGTPHFMSPEQANGVEKKDIRMDVWSVGVLLYRIVSGKYPFNGESAIKVLYNILETEPIPIEKSAPCLPPQLCVGISAALRKDPDKRLPNLTPLIEALQDYFYDIGVRDTAEVVRRYLTDPDDASFSLAKLLVAYHMRKGKELYESGQLLLSKAHVARARRIDPRNTGIARTYKKLQTMEPGPTPRPASALTSEAAGAKTGQYEQALRRSRRRGPVLAGVLLLLTAVAAAYFLLVPRLQNSRSPTMPTTTMTEHPSEVATRTDSISDTTSSLEDTVDQPTLELVSVTHQERVHSTAAEPFSTSLDSSHIDSTDKSVPAVPRADQREGSQPANTPPPPPALVKIRVTPPDAIVMIDGVAVTHAEQNGGKKIAGGKHVLTAEAPGHQSYRQAFEAERGTTQIIAVSLTAAERQTGQLHVHSYPWAQVFVDGEFKGNAPTSRPLVLSEGTHTLELRRDGYAVVSKTIEIVAGETVREKVRLEVE